MSGDPEQREFRCLFPWSVLAGLECGQRLPSLALGLVDMPLSHHSLAHRGCSLHLPFWVVMDFPLWLVPGCHLPMLVLTCAHHSVYSSLHMLCLFKPFGSALCFASTLERYSTSSQWLQFSFVAWRSFVGAHILEPCCHFIFWIIPKHPLVAWQYANLAELANVSRNSRPCIFLVRAGATMTFEKGK